MIFDSWPCIRLRHSNPPTAFSYSKELRPASLLFLYGRNVCPTCSIGKFLFQIGKQKDTVIFVASDYTPIDIENLKKTFLLENYIVNGDREVESYYKKVVSCQNQRNKGNVYIEFEKKKKIKTLMFY
jgi:hypothetical protein